jgi:hypothetical protein
MSNGCSLILWADRPAVDGWMSPAVITSLVGVAVLLVGAAILALVNRWRKQPRKETTDAGDQLSHFRSLYDRGELSREEFDQIRAKLGVKLRKELNVPNKSDPKDQQPPAEPPKSPDPPVNGTSSA